MSVSCRSAVAQLGQKKTVSLVAVFSFANLVIVVEFIVETHGHNETISNLQSMQLFFGKKPKLRFCLVLVR